MAVQDDGFEPRLGRMRGDPAGPRVPRAQRPMLERIARAGGNPRRLQSVVGTAPKAASGRFNARGRGSKIVAGFPRAPVWSFDRASGQRVRMRRVLVKARIVKLAGKAGAAQSHLRYLERDGTTRDGQPGRLFSTFSDEADRSAFLERGADDRHQFRFIVSPEDGRAYETLQPFARDLMAQLEQDLGTTLDWVAVEHHDTGHPHVHIVLRGVTEDGKALNIAGDYIAHGIRHRAGELITRDLGPETEREVERQLEREVDAERLTRLDRRLLSHAEDGVVDLARPDSAESFESRTRPLLVARARKLEAMGLAEEVGQLRWSLAPDAEMKLQEMGRRGDIIRTMHAAMTREAGEPASERYRIHERHRSEPIVGRVVARGLADEMSERRYLVVEGIDGHTHYAEIGETDGPFATGHVVSLTPAITEPRQVDRTIADVAAANEGRYSVDLHLRHDANARQRFAEAHVRRLEAIRRATGGVERRPDGSWSIAPDHLDRVRAWEQAKAERQPYAIETVATRKIDVVARLDAPTWLDRQITGEVRHDLADHGFGREVKRALDLRRQWLVEQGLAEEGGSQFRFQRDLMATLRRRELLRIAGQLSEQLQLEFTETRDGGHFSGVYQRSVEASGGRYALIAKSREFTLVPWRPEMERQLGRQINVRATGGGIDWTIGPKRSGPAISM